MFFLLVAGLADAADPARSFPMPRAVAPSATAPAFEQLDADRDGAIEVTEAAFEQPLWRGFEKADANRDRRLSRDEFNRWAAKMRPAPLTPSDRPRLP